MDRSFTDDEYVNAVRTVLVDKDKKSATALEVTRKLELPDDAVDTVQGRLDQLATKGGRLKSGQWEWDDKLTRTHYWPAD
jgi:hypothetical protein